MICLNQRFFRYISSGLSIQDFICDKKNLKVNSYFHRYGQQRFTKLVYLVSWC